MPQQDLFIGLGCLAYAVAMADGEVHQEEVQAFAHLLQQHTHGEMALFSLKLKAKLQCLPEEAYQFAFRRFSANITEFSRQQKEQFCYMLQQIAQAHAGISAAESAVLKRIRLDLGRLSLFSKGPQPA